MSIMLPAIIQKSLVTCFKYWNNGVQEAISYQNEMYTYVRGYTEEKRLQAYAFACEMTEQNLKSCITYSDKGYEVWINLKSLANSGTEENSNLLPAFS